MTEQERLKDLVRRAFATVERPPNGALHASDEGDEGELLEREFADKHDWRTLDPDFLDQAPRGFASALSFFSDAALRYFLPAYLLADLDGRLDRVDLASRLSTPFTDASRRDLVNPRRYGNLTWFDSVKARFRDFRREEIQAIAAYLAWKNGTDEGGPHIAQALANFWQPRAAEKQEI